MFRRTLLLTLVAMISTALPVCAQEDDSILSKLKSGLTSINNPFLPQLPKKKEPKIEEPIKQDDSVENYSMPTVFEEPITEIPEEVAPIIEVPIVELRPVPPVAISGVIWNSERPQAIINGRIIGIGESIFEIQIQDIQKNEITGLFDGRTVILKP